MSQLVTELRVVDDKLLEELGLDKPTSVQHKDPEPIKIRPTKYVMRGGMLIGHDKGAEIGHYLGPDDIYHGIVDGEHKFTKKVIR